MWRNYLTVGVRALAKNKTYTFINIFGLAIGMAACLMILLFVRYELTYDSWLPNAENTYQFQTHYTDRDTGEPYPLQMSAYVGKGALLKDFPQIENAVYALSSSPVVIRNGESTSVEDMKYVDGPFFDVVQIPLVKGNRATALANVGSIVLTESEAKKRFGNEDPMGQTLTLVSAGKSVDYRVTGIIKDLPKNSHMKLTLVARFDPRTYFADQPNFMTAWGWQSGWVYVSLKPGTDPDVINSQLKAWEKRNIPDENYGGQRFNQGDQADFTLVNVRDVHLGKAQQGAMTPGNDRRTIATFGVVAALILGMACINFTNLATARASQRAREVALRKVLGANRRQLVVQFIGESILVAAIAMLVALAIVELAMPAFANFLDADLAMGYVGEGGLLLPILGLVLLVGAAGGVYPAFYLSRFQPAQVLKANKSAADAQGSGRLRNMLVVGQFAVSIGLIICTAVVYAQTVYARTADPGYKREGLLQVEIGRRQLWPVTDTLVREVAAIEGVTGVGRTGIGIATGNNSTTGVQLPGKAEPVNIDNYGIDTKFFDTMGIKLVAGRNFDESRAMDDATTPFPQDPDAERAFAARGVNVIVNERGAKRLGIADPQAAIGKQFKAALVDPEFGGAVPITVIGVVADSRFRSIREPVDPIMFVFNRFGHSQLMVRYDSSDPAGVRQRIEQVWKRIAPEVPFEAEFSEDIVAELYDAEEARAQIFAAFAGLSIIVGCLGLFGLAAFTAERRTKEIGIRKVLGARDRDIVRLLVWQFSQPVMIANLIAWPVAWWLMRDWLNTFDTRIGLNPGLFLIAGLLALAIATATIVSHALRVARANPIHALRYE